MKAFNYDLEPAGLNTFKDFKLHKFSNPSGPNYISRNVFGGIVNANTNTPKVAQAVYENYLKMGEEKASHLQFIQQFGIKLPPTFFTAGSNDLGYLTLYSLTQFVQGSNLLDYDHTPVDSEDALEQQYTQLFQSLCSYYSYCFNNDKSILFDTFGLQQYVLSNSDKEIYLVDTDSAIMEPNHNLADYLVRQLHKSNNTLTNKFQTGSNRMQQVSPLIEHLAKEII